MSSRLHLPIRERRSDERARRGVRRALRRRQVASTLATATAPAAAEAHAVPEVLARPDIAARKVREAGGPIDLASYVCLCGFAFAAPVSTSVQCPHCGAEQAW